ncbi:DUF5695 domain-containing protein [Sphingomonas sp. RIT328]|uniref:DUF5695 domain-containing protein n=1 Tax=Sphingomonas sp. RIT328 TaxID=1470591 RepID=UPI000449939F|nr:DUF5695 domain-containing protein [Sphingomonas sp. RIT328]EZP49914.1 hypothetical protein BW41_03239 [Sphingomonas sp. RIT328]
MSITRLPALGALFLLAGAAPAVPVTPFAIGALHGTLRADTQTLAQLSPAGEPAFSFVPTAREAERSGDGYNHVGDLDLRLRVAGGTWRDFGSAHRRRPIVALPTPRGTIAAADITATMGDGMPLLVERRWQIDRGALALRFRLTNRSAAAVEIGGLGMPMAFDNIITGRDLDQAHAQASFADPYIGRDAGYLQVTRLNGQGPALLVLPGRDTPFEAYAPLADAAHAPADAVFTEKTRREQTFEGFYDWLVHSRGFAEREWRNAGGQWNAPTSRLLAPGASLEVGVRFVAAPTIRGIEPTLIAQRRPVAIGLPGYVVPTEQSASLFVRAPSRLTGFDSSPADALAVRRAGSIHGWTRLAIRSHGYGPARLTLHYADGQQQTVSYYVTRPLDTTMAALGRFATTRQWYEGKGDPFGRSPAILTYDHEAQRIVDVEPRVWIAGMSDEGGAGSWVAAMMKQLDHPDAAEVAKLERLVDETVVGRLQVADGPHRGGVRKSLFYYDPARFPTLYRDPAAWKSWTAWDAKQAGDLGRSYNYPHVAIGHWVLYRLARNHVGLVTRHDWRWYLDWAQTTIVAMMRDAPYYTQFGQMEGNVFLDILADLRREGMTAEADRIEALMRARTDHWAGLRYPFGSEMAWDSTGQPEVYDWLRHFGYERQAVQTREVILGYDPTLPSWGYNGNARRYWDFLYGGKTARIERQIHHYGSTNNALPLFDSFRRDPTDLHLLRVAYGGLMGGVTNIDRDGFASAAFHAWPDRMQWDAYSGDYGMGYFAHAYAVASYLVDDPTFGWLGFGGEVTQAAGSVTIRPRDGARTRLFIAPAGQWITLAAGRIAAARYAPKTGAITLTLDPADAATPAARLFVARTTPAGRDYAVAGGTAERGGVTLPLATTPVEVTLRPR